MDGAGWSLAQPGTDLDRDVSAPSCSAKPENLQGAWRRWKSIWVRTAATPRLGSCLGFAEGVVQAVRQPLPTGRRPCNAWPRRSTSNRPRASCRLAASGEAGPRVFGRRLLRRRGGCGEHLPNGGRSQRAGPVDQYAMAVQALKPGPTCRRSGPPSTKHGPRPRHVVRGHLRRGALRGHPSELPRGAGADARRPHGVVQPGRARVQPWGGGDEGARAGDVPWGNHREATGQPRPFSEALPAFESALELQPGRAEILLGLATVHHALHNQAERDRYHAAWKNARGR